LKKKNRTLKNFMRMRKSCLSQFFLMLLLVQFLARLLMLFFGGRVVGIVLFLMLLFFTSNIFALRFSPLIFACTQILLLLATNSIEKQKE